MSSVLTSDQQIRRFEAPAIAQWIDRILHACGVCEPDAGRTADILVRTSLRGIDTHGVTRVLAYVEKLRSGTINPRPALHAATLHGMLVCEGDRGLGQVAMGWAMEHAVASARDRACMPFLVRGLGHLDAIGMFALAAAEQGMIAFIAKTTEPLMAPMGGHRPAIGNNPLAFAMPLADRPPLVFDAAVSTVGRSKLHAAAADDTTLGEGWAIGPDGNATDDPALGLDGALLPIGGHKGIGLAMLIQCLAGSLGAVATDRPREAGATGLFGLVLNPALIHGRAAFEADSAAWLATYLAAAGEGARYPGARAADCESERRATGLPLSAKVVADLKQAAALTDCPFDIADWSAPGQGD